HGEVERRLPADGAYVGDVVDTEEAARQGAVFERFQPRAEAGALARGLCAPARRGRGAFPVSQPGREQHGFLLSRAGLRYNQDAIARARRPSAGMVPGWGGTCLPAEPPRPTIFSAQGRPLTESALLSVSPPPRGGGPGPPPNRWG